MGLGGVLAQYASSSEVDADALLLRLAGQVIGFLLVVAVSVWLLLRDRRLRSTRPAPPDWYPDPWGEPYERWWNGATWTGNVRAIPWPGLQHPGVAPQGVGPPPRDGDHTPPAGWVDQEPPGP